MTSTPDDVGATGAGLPPGAPGDGDTTRLDPGRRVPRRHGPGAREDVTILDPGRRAGGPRARGAGTGTGELPASLAGRFALVNELPAFAGEARLYLVRVPGDDQPLRVLKVYHDGRVPDARARAWLSTPKAGRSAHIAELLAAADLADGCAYELMEHLAGGDLSEMLRSSPQNLSPATLTAVVAQVAESLAQMHAAGIVHRDVKPANVLVRSQVPFDVALADFGVATFVGTGGGRSYEAEGEFLGPQLLTFRFAAPEWLVARWLGPAADWWALGMTIAELAGGRHPFGAWTDEVILRLFAAARPVDLSGITDPRLLLLCRGLLVRDAAVRWGAEQVGAWLRGESPDVAEEYPAGGAATAPRRAREAFLYLGTPYTDPVELVGVLTEDWESVASLFFPGRRRDAEPWRRMRDWLATLGDAQYAEPGRSELIDALEARHKPADIKLYQLLRWLYPAAPPVYRRAEITSAELPALARRAAGAKAAGPGIGQGAAGAIVADLWEHGLLLELARAPGGTGLADADQRWRDWHERWRELADTAGRRPRIRQLLANVPPETVLAYLLWLAAEEESARAWLANEATRARAQLRQQVPWFSWLTRPGADVLRLLCAVLLAPDARLEAQQIMEELRAERRRRQWLMEGRAVHAWFRRHDRPTALGWAAGAIALMAIFWSWMITLADILPFASAASVGLAWACVILSVVVLAAAEIGLAAVIGGPYHPAYSLIGTGATWAAAVARAIRGRGLLFVAILVTGLAAVLAATTYLPFLLPLASTAGEVAWVVARYRRWRADEEDRAQQIRLAERELLAAREGRTGLAGGPAA